MKTDSSDAWCSGAFPKRAPVHQRKTNSLKALAINALGSQPSHIIPPPAIDYVGAAGASGSGGAAGPSGARDACRDIRKRLKQLAASLLADTANIQRLERADLAECADLDEVQLGTYVALLTDSACRQAGNAPPGHTAAIHCHHCGPVWAHPDVAAVLPVVRGWPRALGCPWCFVRKAGGYIPRPLVTCGQCQSFSPNDLNPNAGMGNCLKGDGAQWPLSNHSCGKHQPTTTNGGSRQSGPESAGLDSAKPSNEMGINNDALSGIGTGHRVMHE